ncbi:MAG: hypothetical protein GWP10_22395 [Nitrospiraceae bacterium]|nr:hypothetical protein [Nitrospiraceae bacterium]
MSSTFFEKGICYKNFKKAARETRETHEKKKKQPQSARSRREGRKKGNSRIVGKSKNFRFTRPTFVSGWGCIKSPKLPCQV